MTSFWAYLCLVLITDSVISGIALKEIFFCENDLFRFSFLKNIFSASAKNNCDKKIHSCVTLVSRQS